MCVSFWDPSSSGLVNSIKDPWISRFWSNPLLASSQCIHGWLNTTQCYPGKPEKSWSGVKTVTLNVSLSFHEFSRDLWNAPSSPENSPWWKGNNDIRNIELLAIILALEEWRHWLEVSRHPFMVCTYHKNLEYLREAKKTLLYQIWL